MLYIIYPDVDIWNYMFDGFNIDKPVTAVPLNRNCNKIQLLFRKMFQTLRSDIHLLFGKDICKGLQSLTDKDSLLICDYTDLCLIKTISANINPSVRKSLWLWNLVRDYKDFEKRQFVIEQCDFKIYTFDQVDAQKYNLNWLSQFLKCPKIDTNASISSDFYFLGFEKNRRHIIENLRKQLKQYNLDFRIIHNSREMISYSENMNNISKTRCLVEIVQDGQAGLTLRALEAMFLNKKLLTNNRRIKEFDFYNSNNIFIYGVDDLAHMDEFMSTPFQTMPEDVCYKYTIDCWVNNFFSPVI